MSATAARHDQRPALTAVRGIAAWWVVLYHFREYLLWLGPLVQAVLARGYLAVDFFFLLSGYIMSLTHLHEFARPDLARYANFLTLRLARIYPLHIVVLSLYVAVPVTQVLWSGSHALPPGRYDIDYFLASVVLVQNWGMFPDMQWNVPAWSISTEWFAYLCFPLLAWMVNRIVVSWHARIAALVVVIAASTVFPAIAGGMGGDISRLGLVRCVLEFCIGMLVFRLIDLHARHESLPVVALAVLLVGAAWLPGNAADMLAIPISCTLLVLLALKSGVVAHAISGPALMLLGVVSYSTYLAHYLVRDVVKLVLVGREVPDWLIALVYLAGVAAASVVLNRLVEVPGRRLLRRIGVRWLTPSRG